MLQQNQINRPRIFLRSLNDVSDIEKVNYETILDDKLIWRWYSIEHRQGIYDLVLEGFKDREFLASEKDPIRAARILYIMSWLESGLLARAKKLDFIDQTTNEQKITLPVRIAKKRFKHQRGLYFKKGWYNGE